MHLDQPVPTTPGSPDPVGRVLTHLRENCGRRVSLDEMAHIAGLSRFHFIRVFQSETGTTPYQYMLDVRVACAARLIASGVGICRTAFRTGFSDQSHLTRHFKRRLGITPGRYATATPRLDDPGSAHRAGTP